MHIRFLTTEDAAQYQALRLRGLLEQPTAFASSYEEESALPLAEVATRIKTTESSVVLGAFVNELLVGLAGVQRESMAKLHHKAWLWGMYVSPEHRKSGIGSVLLEHALSFAWNSLGVAQINLGVHTANPAALALYERFGFEIWGTEKGALVVGGQFQDEHHMVCRAPSAA